MNKIIKRLKYFLPAILWMSFIFFLSTRSTAGIGTDTTNKFLILKSFHLIEYGVLFLLFWFGFRLVPYSILAAYLYALTDEFHQTFIPGRTGRFLDTFYDLFGILIGLAFLLLMKKYFKPLTN